MLSHPCAPAGRRVPALVSPSAKTHVASVSVAPAYTHVRIQCIVYMHKHALSRPEHWQCWGFSRLLCPWAQTLESSGNAAEQGSRQMPRERL